MDWGRVGRYVSGDFKGFDALEEEEDGPQSLTKISIFSGNINSWNFKTEDTHWKY